MTVGSHYTPRPKGVREGNSVSESGSLVTAGDVEEPVRAVILGVINTKQGEEQEEYPNLSYLLPSKLLQELPMGQTQSEARGQGSPGEVVCRNSPPMAHNRWGGAR